MFIAVPSDHVTKGLLMNEELTLSGWWVFAGVLLIVAGILNIIYGIAAIGDSKFFTDNAHLHHQRPPHLGLDHC